jgi:hypothetical protein
VSFSSWFDFSSCNWLALASNELDSLSVMLDPIAADMLETLKVPMLDCLEAGRLKTMETGQLDLLEAGMLDPLELGSAFSCRCNAIPSSSWHTSFFRS